VFVQTAFMSVPDSCY